jgi:hypothetical protein
VCEGSGNQGAACASTSSTGLTRDCPAPLATAATLKCYKGTNNGATCVSNADCPGGVCAQLVGDIPVSLNGLSTGTSDLSSATGLFCPSQTAVQKGAFLSSICAGGTNGGKPCTVAGDCPGGSCRGGTLNNYCVGGANDGKGCIVASSDCPGGACTKAGTLAELIHTVGSPAGALVVGTPKNIKLASTFCVPATLSASVNGAADLPGPGATVIVGNVNLLH